MCVGVCDVFVPGTVRKRGCTISMTMDQLASTASSGSMATRRELRENCGWPNGDLRGLNNMAVAELCHELWIPLMFKDQHNCCIRFWRSGQTHGRLFPFCVPGFSTKSQVGFRFRFSQVLREVSFTMSRTSSREREGFSKVSAVFVRQFVSPEPCLVCMPCSYLASIPS